MRRECLRGSCHSSYSWPAGTNVSFLSRLRSVDRGSPSTNVSPSLRSPFSCTISKCTAARKRYWILLRLVDCRDSAAIPCPVTVRRLTASGGEISTAGWTSPVVGQPADRRDGWKSDGSSSPLIAGDRCAGSNASNLLVCGASPRTLRGSRAFDQFSPRRTCWIAGWRLWFIAFPLRAGVGPSWDHLAGAAPAWVCGLNPCTCLRSRHPYSVALDR